MIIREAGYLMLGSRLKRLGDKVLSEVRKVYDETGVEFETPWFPIFYVLQKKGNCSIQEMSAQVEVSHSAISQVVSQLEKKGLIRLKTAKSDQRRKEIRLTSKGKELMKQVTPIWVAFEVAFRQHMEESLVPHLDYMEEKIDAGVISSTALEHLHHGGTVNMIQLDEPSKEVKDFLRQYDMQHAAENRVLALRQTDIILGTLLYTVEDTEVLISNLFVDPLYRRRGHARTMLMELIRLNPDRRLRVDQIDASIIQVLSGLNHSFTVNPADSE